jgi:hypothetical protein
MVRPRKASMSGGESERQKDFLYSRHFFSFLVVLYQNVIGPCPCPLSSSPLILVFASGVVDDLWLLASVTMEDHQNLMACEF